jgi:DNA-binding transcriptional regulator of glucitol operon
VAARSYRFAWHPRWLAGHVVVLAASVTMVYLGHWQLTVSEDKGFSLQNFGYALQWWAFSIAALVIWTRAVRDHARVEPLTRPEPPAATSAPVAYRRYVMPTAVDNGDDPELARYNAYLRSLERPEHG